jgi:putative transposase
MKRMGIEAIYRRPNTSKPPLGHKIYPYLLRGLTIERPNHVWAKDITYIPMARGFVYVAAVVSRRVLSHRGVDHDGGASRRRRKPWPKQAGDFQYGSRLAVHQRRFYRSADKERHRDQHGRQRFMPRQSVCRAAVAQRQIRGGLSASLWSVGDARVAIGRYLEFYIGGRPHSSLDRRTPDEAYFDQTPQRAAA